MNRSLTEELMAILDDAGDDDGMTDDARRNHPDTPVMAQSEERPMRNHTGSMTDTGDCGESSPNANEPVPTIIAQDSTGSAEGKVDKEQMRKELKIQRRVAKHQKKLEREARRKEKERARLWTREVKLFKKQLRRDKARRASTGEAKRSQENSSNEVYVKAEGPPSSGHRLVGARWLLGKLRRPGRDGNWRPSDDQDQSTMEQENDGDGHEEAQQQHHPTRVRRPSRIRTVSPRFLHKASASAEHSTTSTSSSACSTAARTDTRHNNVSDLSSSSAACNEDDKGKKKDTTYRSAATDFSRTTVLEGKDVEDWEREEDEEHDAHLLGNAQVHACMMATRQLSAATWQLDNQPLFGCTLTEILEHQRQEEKVFSTLHPS